MNIDIHSTHILPETPLIINQQYVGAGSSTLTPSEIPTRGRPRKSDCDNNKRSRKAITLKNVSVPEIALSSLDCDNVPTVKCKVGKPPNVADTKYSMTSLPDQSIHMKLASSQSFLENLSLINQINSGQSLLKEPKYKSPITKLKSIYNDIPVPPTYSERTLRSKSDQFTNTYSQPIHSLRTDRQPIGITKLKKRKQDYKDIQRIPIHKSEHPYSSKMIESKLKKAKNEDRRRGYQKIRDNSTNLLDGSGKYRCSHITRDLHFYYVDNDIVPMYDDLDYLDREAPCNQQYNIANLTNYDIPIRTRTFWDNYDNSN